jgi:hypothetical protein
MNNYCIPFLTTISLLLWEKISFQFTHIENRCFYITPRSLCRSGSECWGIRRVYVCIMCTWWYFYKQTGNVQLTFYIDLAAFENACYVNGTSTTCSTTKSANSVQKYLYVFMLANALHGAGSTPMFTLGTTYIDTNTKAKNTSFYLGIFYKLRVVYLRSWWRRHVVYQLDQLWPFSRKHLKIIKDENFKTHILFFTHVFLSDQYSAHTRRIKLSFLFWAWLHLFEYTYMAETDS